MLMRALLNSYEYAEKNGLVDRHNENKTVLLPLFHTNLRSNGKDVIKVNLNKDGTLFKAEFLDEKENLIFPVTQDSIARSGKNPPSHPLVDKIEYIVSGTEANKLFKAEFEAWYLYEENKKNKTFEYLSIIKKFIEKNNFLEQTIANLFKGQKYELNDFKLSYVDENNKEKSIDLSKVFLTYSVKEWEGLRDVDITKNTDLHRDYIEYIKSKNTEKSICNISGKEETIITKHRGLKGNAKIISVSNNKETYKGRLNKGEDIISVGYETSEKIHLMIKYLFENKNSSRWLGDAQYLINWFSEDIENEEEIDITDLDDDMSFEIDEEEGREIITTANFKIGQNFIKGRGKIEDDSMFYAALLDKSSNGRISVKYFRELKISKLKENLENWGKLYNWEKYNKEIDGLKKFTPSLFDIFISSYGIERDGNLVFDKASFKKDQMQKLITCVVDFIKIPENIVRALEINIKNRVKYPKTWYRIECTALSVLNGNYKGGKESQMLNRENNNRSYLFGRLISVYERIESAVYSGTEEKRVTNAEKLWNTFINKPASTMKVLDEKVRIYLKKLNITKGGLAKKFDEELTEIHNKIENYYYDSKELNKNLDYNFLFGYYSEKKYLFSKKEKGEDVNDK